MPSRCGPCHAELPLTIEKHAHLRTWPCQLCFGGDDALVIRIFVTDVWNLYSCVGKTAKADCRVLDCTLEHECPSAAKGSSRPLGGRRDSGRRKRAVVARLKASLSGN